MEYLYMENWPRLNSLGYYFMDLDLLLSKTEISLKLVTIKPLLETLVVCTGLQLTLQCFDQCLVFHIITINFGM